MTFDLLKVIGDVVLMVQLLVPNQPCTEDMADDLPWYDGTSHVLMASLEQGCLITYTPDDSIPDALRGYDAFKINQLPVKGQYAYTNRETLYLPVN
jgi:hypothetical protein